MIATVNLNQNTKIVENSQRGPLKPVGTDFSTVLDNTVQDSQKTGMDDIFRSASKKYNVPENLLKAVAKAESGFDPKAVSRCGAQGVMQLMPQTAKALGVTDSFDAEQNIMGGAKYLSQMLDKYDGDTKLALAAYNAGSGNVAKYGGIPPFKETQNYVVKVTKYMQEGVSAPGTPVENKKPTEEVAEKNGSKVIPENGSELQPSLETENPDEIYSYSDYLKLLNELNAQLQLLQIERNMNLAQNLSYGRITL